MCVILREQENIVFFDLSVDEVVAFSAHTVKGILELLLDFQHFPMRRAYSFEHMVVYPHVKELLQELVGFLADSL